MLYGQQTVLATVNFPGMGRSRMLALCSENTIGRELQSHGPLYLGTVVAWGGQGAVTFPASLEL